MLICALQFAVLVLAYEAKYIEVIKDTDALSISELKQMVKKLHGLDLAEIEEQLNEVLRDIGREDVIAAQFEDADSQVGRSGRVGSSSTVVYIKNLVLKAAHVILGVEMFSNYQRRHSHEKKLEPVSLIGSDVSNIF